MWQRFGRAARAPGKEALAVLFVDPKYFDEEKEAAKLRAEKRQVASQRKAELQETKKRKRSGVGASRSEVGEGGRAGKRARALDKHQPAPEQEARAPAQVARAEVAPAAAPASSSAAAHSAGEHRLSHGTAASGLSELETLRVLYNSRAGQDGMEARSGKKSKKSDMGDCTKIAPELDCFINAATRAFKCYRKPINAFYENDRLSKECPRHFCSSRS